MGPLTHAALAELADRCFGVTPRTADPFCVAIAAGFALLPHELGTSPEWAGSTPSVVAFEPHRDPLREAESVRRGLARGMLLRAQAPHGVGDVEALAVLLRG